MRCPYCAKLSNRVVDSRLAKDGGLIRRRRECEACSRRFTTYERVELQTPQVVKKDGRREEYQRTKLIAGLKKAFEKRPYGTEVLEAICEEVEKKFQERGDREIQSREIGEEVMARLQKTDEVAYVRFASVYRSFRDINEFMRELKDLLNEKEKAAPAKRNSPPIHRRD
ncbi:MAG: transcriptional repressor NrdR [Deltaproteobacteria bacterium]|nr:transcriptional repressor NrdR [Deltaproteobacteria bacterium]